MRYKINIILVALIAVFGFALLKPSINAQNFSWPKSLSAISLDIQGSAQTQPQWNLSDKIEEGKKLLRDSPPLGFVEKNIITKLKNGKKLTSQILARKEIALAVLDLETGRVFEKRYWLDMKDIEKADSIRKNYLENANNLPKFMPENIDEEFIVTVNWWNSFNSDLSIVGDSADEGRYIVIGNKYALSNDSIAFTHELTGPRYSDIIYVPYSDPTHTDDLDRKGKEFQSQNVDIVADELDNLGVESLAYPGKPITEAIRPEFVKNILITEQVDPSMIFASIDNGRKLSGRVFVRYATNGEKAFRYTFSKTGAAGAGQIMPVTYASAVEAQPKANLIQDINVGRVDFRNGIKATFVILDMKLSEIEGKARSSSRATKIWNAKMPEEKEEAVAAAYNGGSSKYRPLTGTISLAINETVGFLKKFKMIRELKLFESSANADMN